jgi:hypothetical protein
MNVSDVLLRDHQKDSCQETAQLVAVVFLGAQIYYLNLFAFMLISRFEILILSPHSLIPQPSWDSVASRLVEKRAVVGA